MDADPRSVSVDELLVHAGWIRGLASRLVKDTAAADDLVQRTWLAAMKRPPAAGRPVRAWLATVLRNLLRQDRRAFMLT